MAENKTTLTGIELGRAEFAYKCASEAVQKPKIKKEYNSYVKKLPMLIKTNGLGAAFAFIFSKQDDSWNEVGDNIFGWLKKPESGMDLSGVNSFKELVPKTAQLNSSEYRRLTAEVMAFLAWLRRYSEGFKTK